MPCVPPDGVGVDASVQSVGLEGADMGGGARARSDAGFSVQTSFFTTCTSSTVDARGRSR
jgi:hypothetical protein